ncbi:MAG TPA: helix-turn-helix transcriptional regulator [Clostridia bacterium]|nr:helix-turn-helix transcriptional regulator [Clostridia bacterium]
MLGIRIKHLREEKDMSQLEFAKVLNINNSTLSQYEAGNRVPSDDIKIKIANYFNVSTDYLLGRTNIKSPSDTISNALEDDPELAEFWGELKEREDLQLLFKQTKDISPKGIQQIIRIIKAIEDEEDREDG